MAKSKKYHGVYTIQGKKGLSYGIDYIHPQTGYRIKKILKNATTEAEAADIRATEITDAKRGDIDKTYGYKGKARAVSFERIITEYLKWSKENKKSWQTDIQRSQALKRAFKGKLMSDINPFLIEKYKMARIKSVSKSTVNKELILARQVFKKAIEWGQYNGENPFSKASSFKIPKRKKPGCLSPEQVQEVIDQIEHPVKKDMVEFAFNTGWRIGEITSLKWDEVDLTRRVAWITDPKNGESVELPLNDTAMEIIKRRRPRAEYVFCHLNGKPFKSYLYGTIWKAFEEVGIILPKNKAWHIFRRTWASEFLRKGGDVESLRVQGNWKDYSMPCGMQNQEILSTGGRF